MIDDWKIHAVDHHPLFCGSVSPVFHLSAHSHSLHLHFHPPPPRPPDPAVLPRLAPPLRPVMARVAATPTPSPPPPWWVTEIYGSRRERGSAASTLARWRTSPDDPPSSRSVDASHLLASCRLSLPFPSIQLRLWLSLPHAQTFLLSLNTFTAVGFVSEPGPR